MSRVWLIGANPDCDLVVNFPQVSGRHCRLTREDAGPGYVLEDLGSTNGTYVNGVRIAEPARVEPGATITLGQLVPMPWPTEPEPDRIAPGAVRIGRLPDNDYVVDLPMVSGHHARIVRDETTGNLFLEDLASANGTALESVGNKIGKAVLRPTDTIFLGSHSILAADVLKRFAPGSAPPAPPPKSPTTVAEATAQPRQTAIEEEFRRIVTPGRRAAVLLAQAPVAALALIVLGSSQGRPLVVFGLGLAAIGFGLSNAILGTTIGLPQESGEGPPRKAIALASRFVVLGALGAIQCALMWIIAAIGTGLKGSWGPTLALLFLASTVGLSLGLLIVALAPRRTIAWLLLLLVLLPLWFFGGGPTPLARMSAGPQAVACALPSRWAFEGLLLIESDASHRPGAKSSETLAEAFFPARTERMGLWADGLALAAMAIGLAAAAAFISLAPPATRAS